MEENKEENEYEYIDFGPEEEGKVKKKCVQLRGDSEYEVVGELGPQQQGNTWQQRVAKLFRWVPQFPEIPWRTSKRTQHNEKSLSPPSQFVTRSEKSNSKDKLYDTRSDLSSCKDKSYVTRSELSSCKEKSYVTRSEVSNCKDKSYVTRSELSNCKDKLCVTTSELSKHHDKDDMTNVQDRMKRRTDGSSSGKEKVCHECPPPPPSLPLTTHQTRVLQSLEKINIPSWFRPVSTPARQRQSQHTDKPQWKRSREQSLDQTVRSIEEPTSHWLSSRETSACPSFSSAYSRLSSTRQAYRSPRDGSIQSWQAPATRSDKEPYIGWRSHQPHQESVSYLLPPAQRLANSMTNDGRSRADLLANMD